MPVRPKSGIKGSERGAHVILPSLLRSQDPQSHHSGGLGVLQTDGSVRQTHPKMAFSSLLEDKGQGRNTSPAGPGP